jgi:hypothetical protein
VVNNIDGAGLRAPDAQALLADLVSSSTLEPYIKFRNNAQLAAQLAASISHVAPNRRSIA